MEGKTGVNVTVDTIIHKQFSDLAGFLYPEMGKKEARNRLQQEIMKERIEKEKKK